MIQLNIPPQNISNKYIFDIIRKKNIFLTPEEWVRQNIVHHLVYNYNYPKSLIKLESSLKYNNLSKRSDIIVYDKKMNIFLLVECKSYKISINESALKQVSVYNKVYKSKNIMISNGINHYVCEVNLNASRYNWIDKIPNYPLD